MVRCRSRPRRPGGCRGRTGVADSGSARQGTAAKSGTPALCAWAGQRPHVGRGCPVTPSGTSAEGLRARSGKAVARDLLALTFTGEVLLGTGRAGQAAGAADGGRVPCLARRGGSGAPQLPGAMSTSSLGGPAGGAEQRTPVRTRWGDHEGLADHGVTCCVVTTWRACETVASVDPSRSKVNASGAIIPVALLRRTVVAPGRRGGRLLPASRHIPSFSGLSSTPEGPRLRDIQAGECSVDGGRAGAGMRNIRQGKRNSRIRHPDVPAASSAVARVGRLSGRPACPGSGQRGE
ncbi:hypothetical protein SAMN05216499_1636 [Actinacidiphila paucisporea]|uniref:Uncharacterized protein n=1 Tax=Actinacidiphila paucisporea TaxID=310782 RepID=A0A1M7R0N0_9ACTN|nr:hypothetical protein SAMN05216499_1636 [Actinacidiphila paucisporea]